MPFLTRFASERSGGQDLAGYYSAKVSMWVIQQAGRELPVIDQSRSVTELATKTATQQETDDRHDMISLVELATKTDAGPEQDDAPIGACVELSTKTEAQMERDDTSPQVGSMFI
ncbi:MAG: hypothetical protein NXH91_06510 [Phyllobacteriaceae bacterium]|nr:hypothetical protein [Phyllobacteriaceae bacterium]